MVSMVFKYLRLGINGLFGGVKGGMGGDGLVGRGGV